jgi:hypothetical protein
MHWQWHGFIELAVDELHQNLHALQLILVGEFNRTLGMFEVKGLVRVGRPIAQALEEELSAHMLKQDSHGLVFGPTRYTFSLGLESPSASPNPKNTYPEYYGACGISDR